MAVNPEDVVDDSIDDMQFMMYSAGRIFMQVSDANDQLDDFAVVAEPKVLPRLRLLTQHLMSPQPQQAWEGFYRRYGEDKQIYDGGLFCTARALTRWRGLAKAPGSTIGDLTAQTVGKSLLFQALTSFLFFCWPGCPSEIKLTSLKDAVSLGQAEETIKLFLRTRDALGLVDVDVQQRFIQGAKTYLEYPIPANTNMRDIVRARSLICRLNEVTALTGAAARISVIDNPRADEEPSV